MRTELNWAAVCPSGGWGVPNWLVVSITTLPAMLPACSSASGRTLQGTDTTRTSAEATVSEGVATPADAPISPASRWRPARSRLNERVTSCPAAAS